MKSPVVLFVTLWIVSNQSFAWTDVKTPADTDEAAATAALANEDQKAEPPKVEPSSVPANDLAKRIQAVTANRSPVVAAVAAMADAGIEQAVIEAYVQTAAVPLLSPNEILYLHEHGVSSQVITALIKRSGEVRNQQAQAQKESQERQLQQQAAQAAANAAQAAAAPPAPQPATYNYFVTSPPTYAYSYPSYAYAYAAYPGLGYSYVRPFHNTLYSPACQPLTYATRFYDFHYSHYPRTSFSLGLNNCRTTPFFTSRWGLVGSLGKPVDFHR